MFKFRNRVSLLALGSIAILFFAVFIVSVFKAQAQGAENNDSLTGQTTVEKNSKPVTRTILSKEDLSANKFPGRSVATPFLYGIGALALILVAGYASAVLYKDDQISKTKQNGKNQKH